MNMPPPKPARSFPFVRVTIIALLIIGALVGGGIWLSNSYRYNHTVVDSCGNTAQDLANSSLLEACASVSGTIRHVSARPDGTVEVQVEPNDASSYARNTANQGLTGGNLLVVISCTSTAPLPSSVFETCAAFHQADIHPYPAATITYVGNLVRNQRFGWIEMRPTSEHPGA